MKCTRLLCFAITAASLGFAGTVTADDSVLGRMGVVTPKAPINLYYCDDFGGYYCDGVSLSFNGPVLTAYGQQTGCVSGTVGGSIVYVLANPGIGVTFGYYPDSGYAGGVASTEITFKPPKWRHLDAYGGVINQGPLCYTPPPAAATNAPPSANPQ